jgi:hypothetical protein
MVEHLADDQAQDSEIEEQVQTAVGLQSSLCDLSVHDWKAEVKTVIKHFDLRSLILRAPQSLRREPTLADCIAAAQRADHETAQEHWIDFTQKVCQRITSRLFSRRGSIKERAYSWMHEKLKQYLVNEASSQLELMAEEHSISQACGLQKKVTSLIKYIRHHVKQYVHPAPSPFLEDLNRLFFFFFRIIGTERKTIPSHLAKMIRSLSSCAPRTSRSRGLLVAHLLGSGGGEAKGTSACIEPPSLSPRDSSGLS